jgi:hypothetical protein
LKGVICMVYFSTSSSSCSCYSSCSCCCSCIKCGCRSRGPRGKEGPPGQRGEPGPQGPPGILQLAHGFAYSQSKIAHSGIMKLAVAGPLQDVELVPEGLKVLQSGVYQISYKALIDNNGEIINPTRLKVVINDSIIIASSLTETTVSTTLNSSILFSLLEGDIVKLTIEVSTGASCELTTLQVFQVS